MIVEKMIEAEDDEITLSVPRFSHIGDSLSNFYLLKREADAIGKKVSVESVDDKVIELAGISGLSGTNPFFAKNKRQFSDIIAPRSGPRQTAEKSRTEKMMRSKNIREVDITVEESVSISAEWHDGRNNIERPLSDSRTSFSFPKFSLPQFKLPSIRFGREWIWIAVGCILVAGVGFVAVKVLPKAEVTIVAQKKDWSYDDSIIVATSASSDIKIMSIPGQIFSEIGNVVQKFPATGKKQVEKNATGQVTVFNSYSSNQQQLVEKTRFMAPDGKLFRLVKTIMVPGAKIVDGKIVPSGIPANIIADASGPDYNIGPVKLFTIPGFKGTPKYPSFYAESTSAMQGGFIGEVTYPTTGDISKANAQAMAGMESGLNAKLFFRIPKEFKILDGSKSYKVLSQKADAEADADGNFGVMTNAKSTIIAFKETDAFALLESRAIADSQGDFEVKSRALTYDLARADFDKGRMSFPAHFKVTLARKIDAAALKTAIAGKSEIELKTMIFALPGLESATISLWPFWVKTVPNNLDKITVLVD